MSLPSPRQDLTPGQWHEGRLIVGIKGGGQAWAKARALLDYAGYWLKVQCESDEPAAGHTKTYNCIQSYSILQCEQEG